MGIIDSPIFPQREKKKKKRGQRTKEADVEKGRKETAWLAPWRSTVVRRGLAKVLMGVAAIKVKEMQCHGERKEKKKKNQLKGKKEKGHAYEPPKGVNYIPSGLQRSLKERGEKGGRNGNHAKGGGNEVKEPRRGKEIPNTFLHGLVPKKEMGQGKENIKKAKCNGIRTRLI